MSLLALKFLVLAGLLACTTVPAYVGARGGWDAAHLLRKDPIQGVANGAGRACAIALFLAMLLGTGALIVGIKPLGGNGSGVISNPTMALIVGLLFVVGGPIVSIFAGIFAAAGAKLGGTLGREWACRCAALAASPWVLVMPAMFRSV